MLGYIDKMKLMFVHKLSSMGSTSIVKHVFLYEIYSCIMFGITSKSITNDLYGVMDRYGLAQNLVRYLQGGTLPDKPAWKAIVKEQMNISEELKWKSGLTVKDARRYWEIQQSLKPNVLYSIIKAHPQQKQCLMTLVKMLTIVENDEDMLCLRC